MDITEREFFEYIKCPMRYEFIRKGINIGQDKTFKKMVYSAINHYYAAKTNGMKADANTLKRKWDNICSQNSDALSPKKVLEGWGLLYRVYEYIKYEEIKFMDINMPYTLEIPGTQISISGQLDPLIDKGDYIEIFITAFDRVMPERLTIDTLLKHTVHALAIKQMFNKDVVINYYVPSQGKCIQTIRGTKDFNRLEHIVKNIGKSINENIIYPRETFFCTSCLAREICKAWDWGEIDD